MSRADSSHKVQMFPFLAVLFCTVGVLLLMIITTTMSRTLGADAVVRPEPLTVTSLDLRDLKLLPVYVVCTADGLEELPAGGTRGIPRAYAAAEALALPDAFERELSWRDGVRATDLDLLESGLADWLQEQYMRRERQAVMFLIRPDGIDTFRAIFGVIRDLNQLEAAAGNAPLAIGYDALPGRGRILIQSDDGQDDAELAAWQSQVGNPPDAIPAAANEN